MWKKKILSRLARYNIRDNFVAMVLKLKIRKVGNSLGVVLPKRALSKLNLREGDTLELTEEPDGSMRIPPARKGNAQFAKQMNAADRIIDRYRNSLRELAK